MKEICSWEMEFGKEYWHCRLPYISNNGEFSEAKYLRTPHKIRKMPRPNIEFVPKMYFSDDAYLEYYNEKRKKWEEISYEKNCYFYITSIYKTKEDAIEESKNYLEMEIEKLNLNYKKRLEILQTELNREDYEIN